MSELMCPNCGQHINIDTGQENCPFCNKKIEFSYQASTHRTLQSGNGTSTQTVAVNKTEEQGKPKYHLNLAVNDSERSGAFENPETQRTLKAIEEHLRVIRKYISIAFWVTVVSIGLAILIGVGNAL